MNKATVTYRGITAEVEIRDYEDAPNHHVEITLTVVPPGAGLDNLAYTRVQSRGVTPKEAS